jgi:hypothetical protein
MPHANFKTVINAPYERVSTLLIDKMEKPKKYVGTIQRSKILERGDGYIVREMYEPKPSDLVIREKIYLRPIPDGEEFIYEHMNNARYTGSFHNILKRVEGRKDQSELEYVMNWTPHPGVEEKIDATTAGRMVMLGVNHLKELAEHPPEVPEFVRSFYNALDSLSPEAMGPLLSDNIRFRMGSHSDVIGKGPLLELNRKVMSGWKSIRHHIIGVYHDRGRTFVECWVDYTLTDGSDYLLPFLTTFERDGEKISNIKVFCDPSPLHHGWPA